MKTRTRVLLGSALILVIVLLVGFVLAYRLVTKSFPRTTGTLAVPGLQAAVSIQRDPFGVPHIRAASEHDVFFAAGFVHAQDRLWQMELIRRAGMGRLAEVVGKDALPIDKMFRTLQLTRLAREMAQSLDEDTRGALQAYADGVNAYIAMAHDRLPVEMDILHIEPEPWTIEHSLLVSRLMAWELNYARWIDVLHGLIVQKVGYKRARELFPAWPASAPVIVPGPGSKAALDAALPLFRSDQRYRDFLGVPAFHAGSNAWAVAGSKTISGKPMLANDPHLALTAPARWYEIHLSAPGFNVYGMSIPGVPFVIIGHNGRVAWGVTNGMLDDADYYVEQVDSLEHPTRYLVDGAWRPMLTTIDTIRVKDGLPVVMTTYRTHRGPIINRFEASAQRSGALVSMRWTGWEVTQDPHAFLLLDRASNWKAFKHAVSYFAAPAQNFVYADVDGNIGYILGGRIPIRPHGPSDLPYPGTTSAYDWKGFAPVEDAPQSFNPPSGMIVTANNKIAGDNYPFYLSDYWEPEWRSTRITELLSSGAPFSPNDFQRFQADLVSLQARELVPVILKAFPDEKAEPADVRTALTYFRNWNNLMRPEDVASTLFESFIVHAIGNTYGDELGPEIMGLYDTLAMPPLRSLNLLMQQDSSAWFDDVRTPGRETKGDIIRKSLREAISDLHSQLGGELKEWRWGTIHQVEFQHLFGGNALLRKIFNVGPFPSGGSDATINNGHFSVDQPFRQTVGPSMRFVIDLSDFEHMLVVLPPGESGHVFHPHYDDQVTLWLNGAYRHVVFDENRVGGPGFEHLELRPRR